MVLKAAGIQTDLFKPYSTRSASASKAARAQIPLADIMKMAGWSRESTFEKFYHKNLIKNTGIDFAERILVTDQA